MRRVVSTLMGDTASKGNRGAAAQFFVAGELNRRGIVAVVTLGNTPNTDILCSNPSGTKFAHIVVGAFSLVGKQKGDHRKNDH